MLAVSFAIPPKLPTCQATSTRLTRAPCPNCRRWICERQSVVEAEVEAYRAFWIEWALGA